MHLTEKVSFGVFQAFNFKTVQKSQKIALFAIHFCGQVSENFQKIRDHRYFLMCVTRDIANFWYAWYVTLLILLRLIFIFTLKDLIHFTNNAIPLLHNVCDQQRNIWTTLEDKQFTPPLYSIIYELFMHGFFSESFSPLRHVITPIFYSWWEWPTDFALLLHDCYI